MQSQLQGGVCFLECRAIEGGFFKNRVKNKLHSILKMFKQLVLVYNGR
jgi:hypothetical protein